MGGRLLLVNSVSFTFQSIQKLVQLNKVLHLRLAIRLAKMSGFNPVIITSRLSARGAEISRAYTCYG